MSKEDLQQLNRLIVVGDGPLRAALVARVEEDEIQSGYVIRVGPGYPIPLPGESDMDSWKKPDEEIKYIPLQARVGDLAIFLQKGAIEIVYNDEKYFIVPQQSILLLERDEELFD